MRILVKILLSILMVIIGVVLQVIISVSGNESTGFVRLIPAAVMFIGIIAVWKYKPAKESTDKDLDKSL